MPLIEGLDQNTPEWICQRIGMVTASRMADVMSMLKKGGESQKRKDYKAEIVCETLTGRASEHYVSPAMEHGIETEPLAAAAYEIKQGVELEPGGFWAHDTISRWGASPDRLVGDDGIVEIKCPTTATHLDYLLGGVVPEEYIPQITAQLACTGRKWCDFVSYDDRLPAQYRLFIKRYERDEAKIKEAEDAVLTFLEEVTAILQRLSHLGKEENP